MIDWNEKLGELITHPILTATAGAATAAVGAVNKVTDDLPIVHDILSDGAMVIGLLTCIAGLIVQIRIGKIKSLELKMRDIELQRLERDFDIEQEKRK